MIYVYKAQIMTDLTNAYGFNNSQEATDKTDFETNFKAQTVAVSGVEIMENSAIINKTYTQFKALITGDITWADVKTVTVLNRYDLYLITDTQL